MKKNINQWDWQHDGIIDQRSSRLPDAWLHRSPTPGQRNEWSPAGVHQTGRQERVLARICELVDNATEMVVVSSFLLADRRLEECLFAAAQRGVRVYLLLACETRLDKVYRPDDEFGKECLADHVRMLNRLAGWALIRSAPFFHAKTVLVDPHLGGRGILSTANFTAEALTRNEELAVELSSSEVNQVFATLRWALWESARHEMTGPVRFEAVNPLGEIALPPANQEVRALLGAQDTLTAALLELIAGAKSKLMVSSYGWDVNHPVVKALCERAANGVQVTVLARIRDKAMPALLALRRAGAQVLGFEWLHAKAIWSDTGMGMILTANLEPPHGNQGFELGLLLNQERAAALAVHLESWINSAACKLEISPSLGSIEGGVRLLAHGKSTDLEVLSSETMVLKDIIVASAEQAESTTVAPPKLSLIEHPSHAVHYSCCVRVPRLAANAREHFRPARKGEAPKSYVPPVFREPGGKLVVAIGTRAELPSALLTLKESGAKAIVVKGTI